MRERTSILKLAGQVKFLDKNFENVLYKKKICYRSKLVENMYRRNF